VARPVLPRRQGPRPNDPEPPRANPSPVPEGVLSLATGEEAQRLVARSDPGSQPPLFYERQAKPRIRMLFGRNP
jgi:hypothetical protein